MGMQCTGVGAREGGGDWGLKQYSVHSSSCPQNIQETDNCGNQASSSSSAAAAAAAAVLVLLAAEAWIIQHLPYLAVPAAKQSGKPTHKRWGWCHGRGYYENDICPGGRERGKERVGGGWGREYWILDCCFWNTAPTLSTGFSVLSHAHDLSWETGSSHQTYFSMSKAIREGSRWSIAKVVCIGVDPLVYPRPICPCPEVRA